MGLTPSKLDDENIGQQEERTGAALLLARALVIQLQWNELITWPPTIVSVAKMNSCSATHFFSPVQMPSWRLPGSGMTFGRVQLAARRWRPNRARKPCWCAQAEELNGRRREGEFMLLFSLIDRCRILSMVALLFRYISLNFHLFSPTGEFLPLRKDY